MGSYNPITPVVLSPVGAGLAGLTTAIALGVHSLPAVLIECRPKTLEHPRADSFTQWTVEIFRSLGLGGDWFEGLASNPWQNQSEENTLPDPKYSLYQGASTPQAQLELVLFEYASRVGVDVRVHHEFVGMSQDADGVTAVIKDHTASSMYTIRAQYLVAADGHRSAVRETLAIPRNGQGTVNFIQSVLFLAPEPKPFLQKGAKQFTIEQPGLKAFMIAYQDEQLVLHLPNDHEYNDDIICEVTLKAIGPATLVSQTGIILRGSWHMLFGASRTHSYLHTLGLQDAAEVRLSTGIAPLRMWHSQMPLSAGPMSLRLLLALALPFPNFPPWHLVPLEGSISYAELAVLADVPERALKNITRMATTNGLFIQMPPGHVSHLATSALLQTNSGFHNWAAFNCDISPPTAMAMVDVHEKWPDTLDTAHTAYNISTNSQRDTVSLLDICLL
ncbi:hypothetical protein CFD26_103996 [Aspergillus turcosus]|uniref:FAD-binding domain-containing protein n=1 Tax=Aspergillus turcosus TaxID=1245748 RepID=A0A421DD19_9EURO|nr:hypothetical protein CFD26_103996 [Aspergillus turcosus]